MTIKELEGKLNELKWQNGVTDDTEVVVWANENKWTDQIEKITVEDKKVVIYYEYTI